MTTFVQLITSLERGGAQRVALETAVHLAQQGHRSFLMTGAEDALGAEARRRLGSRLRVVPSLQNRVSLGDVAALCDLQRALSQLRSDPKDVLVVHTHSSKAGVLGRLAAASLPHTRIVHTVHGFGLDALGPKFRPFLLAAEQMAAGVTDALVFVNEHDRTSARTLLSRTRATFHTIRAGIDPARLVALSSSTEDRARARRQLGIPLGVPVILTVANFKAQKDPLFHLDVFAALHRRCPDAHFLFLGDGPLRATFETQRHALGLEGRVHAPGFVADPASAYAAADGYLLASRWEGLPCSVLEALAAGLPVVLRDGGWGADVPAAPQLTRCAPHATADVVAEALERAVGLGRSPFSLPAEFTRDGMLEGLVQVYGAL